MDKKTEEFVDNVAEILETMGMEEGTKYLAKHDKTRKYIYSKSEPMGKMYFSDESIKDKEEV